MNTKRVVKQYLRAIRKELPLPYITSKVIIKEIRQAIRGRARCARASQGVVHTARARGASPYRARVPIFFARVKRSVFSCENMRA